MGQDNSLSIIIVVLNCTGAFILYCFVCEHLCSLWKVFSIKFCKTGFRTYIATGSAAYGCIKTGNLCLVVLDQISEISVPKLDKVLVAADQISDTKVPKDVSVLVVYSQIFCAVKVERDEIVASRLSNLTALAEV
jgi:hypothetical protein